MADDSLDSAVRAAEPSRGALGGATVPPGVTLPLVPRQAPDGFAIRC